MSYGAYNLQCVDCHIPVFRAGTFPVQSIIPSFNLTQSGIQNITTDAFTVLPKLNYLYLQHNLIFSIEKDAFATLQQLYELNLGHNQLGRLTPGIFNGINSVSIMLDHNLIKEIPENAFVGVKGIMAFNISFNRIGVLHAQSFKGLTNLEILDLQHNKICYIPLGIFKYLDVLKDLNLKGNKLRSFVPGTFSGLKNLLSINLANNNFQKYYFIMANYKAEQERLQRLMEKCVISENEEEIWDDDSDEGEHDILDTEIHDTDIEQEISDTENEECRLNGSDFYFGIWGLTT
ncbi:hypothetical protein RN001_003359 [Aquatica leii]|uniref:Uncharacterized protein n=1 Tax=Aquatica leii TaxID=1421715 RepID=A0AAN7QP20_9COLE|nr:hypothetical protein RN001_003359 [Aquatica leii]